MVGRWHDTGDRCNKLDGWFVALISCRCLQLAGVCSVLPGCRSEFCFWWILRVFNSEIHRYYVPFQVCVGYGLPKGIYLDSMALSVPRPKQAFVEKCEMCAPIFWAFLVLAVWKALWVCVFILFKSLLRRMGNLFTCHLIQSWLF